MADEYVPKPFLTKKGKSLVKRKDTSPDWNTLSDPEKDVLEYLYGKEEANDLYPSFMQVGMDLKDPGLKDRLHSLQEKGLITTISSLYPTEY